MRPRALLSSTLIFAGTALGLTVALYQLATPVLELLLPLYRVELRLLMPSFFIDSLAWHIDRDETVVALRATLVGHHVVLGRVFPPGISVQASTLAAHALVHPVLILSLAASWPSVALTQRPVLMLMALPFAVIGMLLDVPLMLWGAVEDLLYWQANPARAFESPGVRVQHFLDGGGRYAMAFALALVAIALFRMVVPGRPAAPAPAVHDDSSKRRPHPV